MSEEELKRSVAETLGLQKGGLPGIPTNAPANEHYYLVNEVENYDTEEIELTQHLNFNERVDAIVQLFAHHQAIVVIEAKIAELRLICTAAIIVDGMPDVDATNALKGRIRRRISDLEQQKATLMEKKG